MDIPRLAVEASAGPGAIPGGDEAVGALRFSARWLREQGFEPGQLSAILVARRFDGAAAARWRRESPRPLRDGVHVVRVGDSLMVKRVQTGVPGRLVLESQNPAYRPIELSPDEVEVVGRVVWKSGRL